ncbi:hypothetical protein DY000_02016922 [Brassica cretica]|uniref:Uncharacterized protein n=1 Tax=Brassica cretica TaxID=69181 RepID=A0ABQ7CXV9_BRACR|nr:hypothetical protein DY000_02016922 [Brassica cretica]
MARRMAEKETAHADAELQSSSVLVVAPTHKPEVQVPQGTGAQVKTGVPFVPDALVQPSGSSTTPILTKGKEKATESMPPPPARKEIVLALRAPSATPVVQPKGRKRKCVRGNDGESSQQEGFFKVSRLARDLTEMQGKLSESEAMLNAIKDFHSAKVSKLEVQIGELERDLGKTASSLLKEKKARKTKSSEILLYENICGGNASHRTRARKGSLRSDQTRALLGRYVATELEPRLSFYVATELEPELGRYVVNELESELGRYVAT